ncbi:hypothetical protein BB558_002244 [Smittium angustum]|uniref:Uncharacterized protein n=1 Tax=Smittium angustum TaxID=133377 RepID=A0A2U1J991_SMIAN|nr:hypothetical protein BB558_002244 [Smittium angustum]
MFRNLPGTKEEDCYGWEIKLDEKSNLTSASVQEYIQYLVRNNPDDMGVLLNPPGNCDDLTWIYEHLCQICIEVNGNDISVLDRSIIQMNEMIYQLKTNKLFSNKLMIPGEAKQLLKIFFKQVYLIFDHVYYNHREIFERFEHMNYLFSRLVLLSKKYDLIHLDDLTVPEMPLTL